MTEGMPDNPTNQPRDYRDTLLKALGVLLLAGAGWFAFHVTAQVRDVQSEIADVKQELGRVEGRLSGVEQGLGEINARLLSIDEALRHNAGTALASTR